MLFCDLLWRACMHVGGWGVLSEWGWGACEGGGACLLIWRAFPIIQLVRNVGQRPRCSSCSPTPDSRSPRLTLYLYMFLSHFSSNTCIDLDLEINNKMQIRTRSESSYSLRTRRWLKQPVSLRSEANERWPSLWIRLRVSSRGSALWC